MNHAEILGRTIAGRFTIKRLLGEGGMAAVYVAEREGEPGEVAVKIMNGDLSADRSFVRRFQREAKAAALVKHPGSVVIHEYGTEGRLSYIVMELLVGKDLYQLLERHGVLPQVRAARILAEVCDVLQVAHDLGIIHRDLKPENIMVLPDIRVPIGERVKVLDFGIAKLLDVDETEDAGPVDSADGPPSAITRVGQIVGTPAYMSPEQCGLLPLDTRSDIYTCGVLLYQLLTGRLPFEGETPFHTASMHIHAPVPSPRALNPSIDPRLDALIQKALAKRPAERHQTARHLGASLRRLIPELSEVAIVAGPISMRQVSTRWARDSVSVPPSLEPSPATPMASTPRVAISPAVLAPPPTLATPSLQDTQASSFEPYPEDEESIESARTLVSTAAELGGAPPQVLLNDPLQRASRPSIPGSEDLPTMEHDRHAAPPEAPQRTSHLHAPSDDRPDSHAAQTPMLSWPTASALPGVPTSGNDEEHDVEDRAVTLVRPPMDSASELDPTDAVGKRAVREVKSTLRSAEEFGLKPPERRPEVQIQISAPPPTYPSDRPMSAPTEAFASQAQSPSGLPPQALKTIRINQPAGAGPNPAPPREPLFAGTPQMTPLPRVGGGTLPMPPNATGLPPMVQGFPQSPDRQGPAGGLLSGRIGLLIGFMAGMVITGIVVAVYLFVLR
ncbi:serine/threonine-protein kinase [Chondromyces crocatus]|uniref:Protein kinase domain-containing protein n=1 Tax=Chondromyces crocatus TaxID=52 RepID=A0A0K1EQM1_CHOCO|nr:serine/threonine-protein kinase [Chondromyces crocatus]AKT43104.1 uncharacterized protein CMC5_073320 [Chondromyces crocatus]